jgi:hypothetical protein
MHAISIQHKAVTWASTHNLHYLRKLSFHDRGEGIGVLRILHEQQLVWQHDCGRIKHLLRVAERWEGRTGRIQIEAILACLKTGISAWGIAAKTWVEVWAGGAGKLGTEDRGWDAGAEGQGRLFLDDNEGLLADGGVGLQLTREIALVRVGRVTAVGDFSYNNCYSVLVMFVSEVLYVGKPVGIYHIVVELVQGVYSDVVKGFVKLYLCADQRLNKRLCEQSLLLHLSF